MWKSLCNCSVIFSYNLYIISRQICENLAKIMHGYSSCSVFPQGSVNFKFGVLYAKEGQTSDDEFFCNGQYLC